MWVFVFLVMCFIVVIMVHRLENSKKSEAIERNGRLGVYSETLQPRFSDIIHGETKKLSPWQTFKGKNPKFASDIETLLSYRNMGECTQRDIDELVASLTRLKEAHQCEMSVLKSEFLDHFTGKYTDEELSGVFEVVAEESIQKEMKLFGYKSNNTMLFIGREWIREYLSNQKKQAQKTSSFSRGTLTGAVDFVEAELRKIVRIAMREAVQSALAELPSLSNDPNWDFYYVEPLVAQKAIQLELELYESAPDLALICDLRNIIKDEKYKALSEVFTLDTREEDDYWEDWEE